MEKLRILPRALIVLGLLAQAACTVINRSDIVYITGNGAHGTNPYSESAAAPQDWKCQIPPGQNVVDDVDPRLDIVEIDGCWIRADNSNLSLTPPTPTKTAFPTPNVWITVTPTPKK